MADKLPRKRHHQNLLDAAQAELVRLIGERDANLASGTFGVLITLDRGQHRHIKTYQEQTVDLTAVTTQ